MQQKTKKIKLEKHGEITVLDIRDDITAFLKPSLNKAYQQANDQGATKILLKIDEDAYINSDGIAVIIQILSLAKNNNQLVGIAGVSGHYKKIFRMLGITKYAKIYDSMEKALEMMAQPG